MTRAAVTARRPGLGAGVRILDAGTLLAMGEAWDDLVARAVEPHPHFSRHAIEAHRSAGFVRDQLGFVTVWYDGRLDAVLPFRTRLDITGLGTSVAEPFLTPFMPSSAPIVAAERFEATLDAFVAGLAEASSGRPWRWPLLSTGRRVGAGMLAAMNRAGWRVGSVDAFERPVLDRRPSLAAFQANHPSKSRLKDLRRRQRRLAERGALTLETATGDALASAVERFLALEVSSWKGTAGSAMACRPQTLVLARSLFAARHGPVSARADTLSLDGRPLAISLALIAGETASLLKTAFDEGERTHAPGLVLEAEIVRVLHETAFADRLDSATLAGSALEDIYTERETVAEVIAVPPGGEGLVSLERRVRLARFEHRARSQAKRVLRRR